MIVFYGWGETFKPIQYAGIELCPKCKNYSHIWICENAKYASLYWIKVAKWSRKYSVMCEACREGKELSTSQKAAFLQLIASIPSYERCAELWNRLYIAVAASESPHATDSENAKASFNAFRNAAALLHPTYSRDEILYVTHRFAAFLTGSDAQNDSDNEPAHEKAIPIQARVVLPDQPKPAPATEQRSTNTAIAKPDPKSAILTAKRLPNIDNAAILLGIFVAVTVTVGVIVAASTSAPRPVIVQHFDQSQLQPVMIDREGRVVEPAEPSIPSRSLAEGLWYSGEVTMLLEKDGDNIRATVTKSAIVEPGATGLLSQNGNALFGRIQGRLKNGAYPTVTRIVDMKASISSNLSMDVTEFIRNFDNKTQKTSGVLEHRSKFRKSSEQIPLPQIKAIPQQVMLDVPPSPAGDSYIATERQSTQSIPNPRIPIPAVIPSKHSFVTYDKGGAIAAGFIETDSLDIFRNGKRRFITDRERVVLVRFSSIIDKDGRTVGTLPSGAEVTVHAFGRE